MRLFEDDDAGYLAWVESHQDGFVVNTYRPPTQAISCCTGRLAGRSAERRQPAIAGRVITSKCAQRHALISTCGRARTSAAH